MELSVTYETKIRILQITDTHLFAGYDKKLLGVNTFRSYNAVLNAVKAERRHLDLVVATGDLSQDHSSEAYRLFAKVITQLPVPCVWLPGNHDYQPTMINILSECGLSSAKQVLLGDHWQLLLLDSQVYGAPYGELSSNQLEWLAKMLKEQSQRYTLLLLHHHPFPSGCIWLDKYSLRNAHMLVDVLKHHPQVETLLCGHIHQELDTYWLSWRVLATPSTCIQFKPYNSKFAIDSIFPGWRYLDLLLDGKVYTKVCRLVNADCFLGVN